MVYRSKISAGKKAPKIVNVFIENTRGGRIKYEYDESLEIMRATRVFKTSMTFPTNYGFIPSTLVGDGDPIDIMILSDESFEPGTVLEAVPVGVLEMEDEHGIDNKILAVPKWDADGITDIDDLPKGKLKDIEQFYSDYKKREKKKWSTVYGWKGVNDAHQYIEEAMETYSKEDYE